MDNLGNNDEFMKRQLHKYYQMDWMMSHGYTIIDIIDAMDEYFTDEDYERPEEYDTDILPTREDMFNEWEQESGFGGEIWASLGEFMDAEFKDTEYIKSLISKMPPDKQEEFDEWYSAEIDKDADLYVGEGMELIENVLEKLGVKYDITDNSALIEFWTDTAGQDIPVEFDYDGSVEDLVKQFTEYAENYDVDEEVELYVNHRGKNGVPESIHELVDDCQEAKDTLMEIAKKLDGALKHNVTYYAVSQLNHGAEHKWIFNEDTIKKSIGKILTQNGYDLDNEEGLFIDCRWPIGGSNSSATLINKMKSEEEIRDFLNSPGDGPDVDDPELVDLAEYYCQVDANDSWCSAKSCTEKFIKKFDINPDLVDVDPRYDDAEKMITALKEIGYKNFDFEDPFYGNNRDMRYSELCDLYQQQIAEKLNIHQFYNIIENSYHSSSLSINSYFDDKEKKLSVLACFTIEAGDHIFMCAEKSPDMQGVKLVAEGCTPKLINAESCTFDASHLEQWTYKDENIWEYESTLPRHEILDLTEKDKLNPEEITAAICYYEHFNYGLFDSPADGHYSVPMVKQMIEDGFTKDRIAIIGKDWDAKEILKKPEIEEFYKKIRSNLSKKAAKEKDSKGH